MLQDMDNRIPMEYNSRNFCYSGPMPPELYRNSISQLDYFRHMLTDLFLRALKYLNPAFGSRHTASPKKRRNPLPPGGGTMTPDEMRDKAIYMFKKRFH
jgi:hypothetical protein